MRLTAPRALPRRYPRFLQAETRELMKSLLGLSVLRWSKPDTKQSASRGEVYQLAEAAMHDQPAMQEVARIMLDATCGLLGTSVEVRGGSGIIPQVFVVRMRGRPSKPAYQLAHADNCEGKAGIVHPTLTMVYWLTIRGIVGGELALLGGSTGRITRTFSPIENDLVVMSGDQVHAVLPLYRGVRESIVTNYYNADLIEVDARGKGKA